MALARANGFDIIEAKITLPLSGNWSGDVVVDAPDQSGLMGAIAMDLGLLRLRGTALRVGSMAGQVSFRVCGGNGGLDGALDPKGYRAIPLGLVLNDLVNDAGEQLSDRVATQVRAHELDRWTRFNETAGDALNDLADRTGYTWRVLYDGTLWVGFDTFAEVEISADLLSGDPHLGRIELGVEQPELVPGVGLLNRQVVQVEHRLTVDRIRTTATFA